MNDAHSVQALMPCNVELLDTSITSNVYQLAYDCCKEQVYNGMYHCWWDVKELPSPYLLHAINNLRDQGFDALYMPNSNKVLINWEFPVDNVCVARMFYYRTMKFGDFPANGAIIELYRKALIKCRAAASTGAECVVLTELEINDNSQEAAYLLNGGWDGMIYWFIKQGFTAAKLEEDSHAVTISWSSVI